MPVPPLNPAEFLAAMLRSLSAAVAARTGWSLSLPLIALIVDRLRGINQRLARLAARLDAGTYAPRRRAAPRRPAAAPKPRAPDPLPHHRGWLVKLLPETIGHRAQLEHLFRQPETAALLQAAPEALARPLRSLCHMLGATPPPALALKRPAVASPPAAVPKAPPPEPPSPLAGEGRGEGWAARRGMPPRPPRRPPRLRPA